MEIGWEMSFIFGYFLTIMLLALLYYWHANETLTEVCIVSKLSA